MSTPSRRRPSDLAARMRQTVSHASTTPAPVEPGPPAPAASAPERTEPPAPPPPRQASTSWPPRRSQRPPTSRYTIDLEHRHREALRDRARELDTTASAIVRALLDLVEDDPTLAERLADAVGPDR